MSHDATSGELAIGRELALEVREAGGRRDYAVNDLLGRFSVQRFTVASRNRLSDALDEAGLIAQPSVYEAQRGERIALATAQPAASSTELVVPTGAVVVRQPEERAWYRRPKRVAALVAALLVLVVAWPSGDPSSEPLSQPTPAPTEAPAATPDSVALEAQQREQARIDRAEVRRARVLVRRRAARRQQARADAASRQARETARRQTQRRAAVVIPEEEPPLESTEDPPVAAGNEYSNVVNCSDTPDANFTPPPGDPNGLDADNDGLACESN